MCCLWPMRSARWNSTSDRWLATLDAQIQDPEAAGCCARNIEVAVKVAERRAKLLGVDVPERSEAMFTEVTLEDVALAELVAVHGVSIPQNPRGEPLFTLLIWCWTAQQTLVALPARQDQGTWRNLSTAEGIVPRSLASPNLGPRSPIR